VNGTRYRPARVGVASSRGWAGTYWGPPPGPGRATTPKWQIRGRRPAAPAPCHTGPGCRRTAGWRPAEPTREDPRGRPPGKELKG
jgi:hypothetical protein